MRDRSSKIGGDLGQASDGMLESDRLLLATGGVGGSTFCALGGSIACALSGSIVCTLGGSGSGDECAIAPVVSRALHDVTAKARTHFALYALGTLRVGHSGLPAMQSADYK